MRRWSDDMPTKLNTDVDIPFQPYFRNRMRSGQKQVTSRTRKMGEVGQTFPAFGYHFLITGVEQRPLWFVKRALWWYEGCESPRAFEATWCQIHKKAGWTPDKIVWVHAFGRLE